MAVKERQTVRKGQSALAEGTTRMRLWDIEAAPGSTLSKLESRAYLAALDAVDQLEARRAEAKASGRFTDNGIADDARQFALSKLVPALHRGRQEVAAGKKEAAERRAKLTLRPPDPTDVVGALRRREIRDWLRGLPVEERRNYIARNLDRLEPEVALAIQEAPAELSGVLAADRNVLLDRALRQVRGLRALEDAPGIDTQLMPDIRQVGSVAHQPAGFGNFSCRGCHGNRVARRHGG
jgi:hypothetical protein